MNHLEFKDTLTAGTPPLNLTHALQALWYDAIGDWQTAHKPAQALDDASDAWVHAYVHRKEGDTTNARYWYRRAVRPVETTALDVEWDAIEGTADPRRRMKYRLPAAGTTSSWRGAAQQLRGYDDSDLEAFADAHSCAKPTLVPANKRERLAEKPR